MHYAADYGYFEVVKHLAPQLKHKNKPNLQGYTPLHLAAKNGHHKIVEYLLDFVDNPNEPTKNYPKTTPLKMASQNKHSETVKVLLDKICERFKSSSIDIINTLEY